MIEKDVAPVVYVRAMKDHSETAICDVLNKNGFECRIFGSWVETTNLSLESSDGGLDGGRYFRTRLITLSLSPDAGATLSEAIPIISDDCSRILPLPSARSTTSDQDLITLGYPAVVTILAHVRRIHHIPIRRSLR